MFEFGAWGMAMALGKDGKEVIERVQRLLEGLGAAALEYASSEQWPMALSASNPEGSEHTA